MIERLDQITMRDFISLVCGEVTVLGEGTPTELNEKRKELIDEYTSISDSASIASYVSKESERVRLKMTVVFAQILTNLVNIGDFDGARKALKEYGYNMDNSTDKQVASHVKAMLNQVEFKVRRLAESEPEKKPITVKDIRDSYSKQTAGLMSHYKMSIDLGVITADIYANLIAQAREEIKAKISAMGR